MMPLNSREFNLSLNPSEQRMLPRFRSHQHFFKEYRAYEILHRQNISIFKFFIIPFQSLVMKCAMFCNFMVIRHWAHMDWIGLSFLLFVSILVITFWSFILEFGGNVLWHSKRNIYSWKNPNPAGNSIRGKELRKFRKSCRPLCVGYDGYFTIKRLSVLKFARSLVRGTFRVLLTLNGVERK